MAQRKPSDKEIKEKAKELATHPVMGHDPDKENKILKGMRWVSSYDPWHYIEDGELPYDSSQLGKDKAYLTEELFVIFHSGKNYVLQYQANGEDYGEDLWRDPKTGNKYDKYSVKCFMYIPQPKK